MDVYTFYYSYGFDFAESVDFKSVECIVVWRAHTNTTASQRASYIVHCLLCDQVQDPTIVIRAVPVSLSRMPCRAAVEVNTTTLQLNLQPSHQ